MLNVKNSGWSAGAFNEFQIEYYRMIPHQGKYTHNFQAYGPEKITKCKVYITFDKMADCYFDKYYVEKLNKTLPGKEATVEEYNVYHKELVKFKRTFVRELLNYLGFDDNVKFTFNQNAGCSCGCSPAFIVDIKTSYDIFVDITYNEGIVYLKTNDEWEEKCRQARLQSTTHQTSMF